MLSTAREHPDLLSDVLRCFLDVWNEATMIGGGFDSSGWSESSSRWWRVFSALGIKCRAPVTCWRVRERFWMLRRAGGGLEREIGLLGDFLVKWLQVFVMENSGCGEREG